MLYIGKNNPSHDNTLLEQFVVIHLRFVLSSSDKKSKSREVVPSVNSCWQTPYDICIHRLYDVETVEVSNDVSLLMIVPPVDSACSAPGQRDTLLQRPDLLPLPVQVFEMVHLGTYRHQLVSRYSRLSCIIELDMALAQHSQREVCINYISHTTFRYYQKRKKNIYLHMIYCIIMNITS